MKYLYQRSWWLFLTLLLLSACTGGPFLTGESTAKAQAQEVIAKAEIGLTIAYRAVEQEAATGVLTKTELRKSLATLDEAGKALSIAQNLRRQGLFTGSLEEALKSQKLLGTVQALLAERIKSQRRTP